MSDDEAQDEFHEEVGAMPGSGAAPTEDEVEGGEDDGDPGPLDDDEADDPEDDDDGNDPPVPVGDVPPGSMSGAAFLAALDFALTACPREPHTEPLQHLVFAGRRVVGSDGRRRHDGYLPDGVTVETPIAFTRQSVARIRLRVKHATIIARGENVMCLTWLRFDGEPSIEIRIGNEHPVMARLYRANVGEIVSGDDPVPADAPAMEFPSTRIPLRYLTDLGRHGDVQIRGRGGRHPIRAEVDRAGEPIGCAFIQPSEAPPAALPLNEPLLAGTGDTPAEARQQSVLALRWHAPPATTPPAIRELLPAPELGSAPPPTIEQPATPAAAVPSSTRGPRKAPPPPLCPAIVTEGGAAWSVLGPLRCGEKGVPRAHGFCAEHLKQYSADERREIARVARLERAKAAGKPLPGDTAGSFED